jgi:hypothetical protein
MHGQAVGQCDWSGIMFKLPGVSLKIGKTRGMYCNWESAVAHAEMVNTPTELDATRKFVINKIGLLPNPAPDYKELVCFGGHMTDAVYIRTCELEVGEIDAIWSQDYYTLESVTLDSVRGNLFDGFHTVGVVHKCPPDYDIACLTLHNEEHVMAKRSLLEPWRNKPRYLDLTMAKWKSLSQDKYERCALQSELNNYEARVSKDAVLPASLLKGMKLPGKSGKALAEYAELHLGQELQCRRRSPAASDAQIPGPV